MCDEEIVQSEIDEILSDVHHEPEETTSFFAALNSTMRSALLKSATNNNDTCSNPSLAISEQGGRSVEYPNKAPIEVLCDEFVDTFLGYDSGMAQLLTQVGECHETLGDVEMILSSFLKRIIAVEQEIGDLRVQAQSRSTTLAHARSVERVIEAMFSRLVVPLDVVQLVAATCARTDATDLGPQFLFALKRLLCYLHNRNGIESTTPSHSRSCTGESSAEASSNSSDVQGRMFAVLLSDCAAFRELLGVTEDLTLLAATHVKKFVESKFKILSKHRTNVAVQQEHLLGPLKPFVLFLKRIVPALRRVPLASQHSGDEALQRANGIENTTEFFAYTPPNVPSFHYRVARSLWLELKLQYVTTMREVYYNNINRYLMQLNRLEIAEGSSGWGIFGGRATNAPSVTLPLMTDRGRVSPAEYGLGGMHELLRNVLAHPLVPIVAQAKRKQISYIETFRSVNVMLCDVVTREFLFTFDFFHGDASVYVPIFLPIVQRIVDYVSEVLLQNHLVKVTAHFDASTVKSCNSDAIGLMTLIRMCQVFKSHMHNIRRLSCLNGFYESLLGLLWPSFKKAFEAQLESLRSLTPSLLMEFLAGHRTADERLAAIHPITLRYAEFSGALMTLCGSLRVRQSAAPLACNELGDDQFVALRTNLSILRVEFLRQMTAIGTEVVLASKGSPSGLLTSCPLLNNVYHVMCVWSSLQQPDIDGGEFEPALPLTEIEDYAALRSVLETAKSQFVEQCLQRVFPKLVVVVRSSSAASALVEDAASWFCSSWVAGVDELRRLVSANVSSQQNQKDILPQICMQLLLYNTRLHAVVATHGFTQAVTRSVVVSNQQLLVKFRTFVDVDASQVSPE